MRIACYKGKSFVSKLIRWFTRSDYSHVAFLLDDGSVIEAWEKGGVLHNASLRTKHTPKTEVDIFEIVPPLTLNEEADLIGNIRDELGKDYDYWAVMRFLTRQGKPPGVGEKWFCSEFVFEMLHKIGRVLFVNTEPWEVQPGWIPRSTVLKWDRTIVT